MPLLFSLTLFCSAFLLFQVQPMVGKMLLPKLGGTPAVWNTCMVFFQAALLLGYAYSHALSTWLGSRRGSVVHLAVMLLPALVLPIAIGDDAFRSAAASDHPVLVILGQLSLGVGLPFFVLSTTAPLLQRWFSDTGHPAARDPYFLYAASNVGSMVALLGYPLVVEPILPLDGQSWYWMWGYAVFAALVAACAATLWRNRTPAPEASVTPEPERAADPLTWPRRLWWVFLSFVPSSLLLGCTTYISTDLAPIPLMWVVPLALYLLTFILVFAKRPPIPHQLASRVLPIAVLALVLQVLMVATQFRGLPFWVLPLIHLFTFFVVALVGHGELAKDRPAPVHLTEFYLWMSVGGVLGGVFNALVAPVVFQHTGLTEYPLALVLGCLLRPRGKNADGTPHQTTVWDVILPAALCAGTVGLLLLTRALDMEPGPVRNGIAFGLPCVIAFTFVDRVTRYALAVAALFVAGAVNTNQDRLTLERNFFGVVAVVNAKADDGSHFRQMIHGNTLHGQMRVDATDADGRHEPLTYYYRTGPVGTAMLAWQKTRPPGATVGVIGLGTGSLAYYARPGDSWTFYEIDPTVERLASDTRYFSFMAECRASDKQVVLGDAYLRLQEVPPGTFDFLVLDAFSSDSIPVHLLTREALALYRSRMKPGGVMAFHISNRYLNLRPILAKLAEDAGMEVRGWRDMASDEEKKQGKSESEWAVLADRESDLAPIVRPRGPDAIADPRWEKMTSQPNTPLWTNNFSNLLSAFLHD
jgi:hypothetical protein